MIEQIRIHTGLHLKCKGSRKGREQYWILEDGTEIKSKDIGRHIDIQCYQCLRYRTVSFYGQLLKRQYVCMSCQRIGEKNNFYGKKHTLINKERHASLMKGKFTGKNNPFYGKHHSSETKKILSKKCAKIGKANGFYGKTHTDETKKILSMKSKKWALDNIDKMKERGLKSVSTGFRKTKPEKILEAKLLELNIPFSYNKILNGTYQYDFMVYDNILLEMHGDYWHGNPLKYGPGKRKLNDRQRYKIEKDKLKKKFAEQHGYVYHYIWEHDIMNGNWSALDAIIKI